MLLDGFVLRTVNLVVVAEHRLFRSAGVFARALFADKQLSVSA